VASAGRPAAPEPRPGVTLFVVAFFASPLILICWAGGHVSLKITGWPRWRLFAASLAGEAFIVWIRGGPVPALAAHFSGLLRLAEQFGAPVVYLPAQGSFLIPQIALSVPVGLLAASLTRRTDLAVPDPATATRAVRREQRDRRQARRLVERVRSSETNSQTNNAMGVPLGGDLTAWRAGRYVVLPDHAARLPRLVLGRPGQGKSVYLARRPSWPGSRPARASFSTARATVTSPPPWSTLPRRLAGRWSPGPPSVHLFQDEPLSLWQGSPAEQVNKLLGVWPWSIETARLQGGLRVRPQARLRAARAARDLHGRAGRPPRPSGPGQGMGQASGRGRPGQKTLKDKLGDVQLRLANLAAAGGASWTASGWSMPAISWSSAFPRWRTRPTARRCSGSSFRTSATGSPARAAARAWSPWMSSEASTAAGEIAVDLLGRG
jgi:hypothetical protein